MNKCEQWYKMLCADDVSEILENAERISAECEKNGGLFASAVGSGCRWYASLIRGSKKEDTIIQRLRSFRAWRDNLFRSADAVECAAYRAENSAEWCS